MDADVDDDISVGIVFDLTGAAWAATITSYVSTYQMVSTVG